MSESAMDGWMHVCVCVCARACMRVCRNAVHEWMMADEWGVRYTQMHRGYYHEPDAIPLPNIARR